MSNIKIVRDGARQNFRASSAIVRAWDQVGIIDEGPYREMWVDSGGSSWATIDVPSSYVNAFLRAISSDGSVTEIGYGDRRGINKINLEDKMEKTYSKDEIIKAVMDYPGGCAEGKERFLKSQLGIELPKARRRIVIEVDSNYLNQNVEVVTRETRTVFPNSLPGTFMNAKVLEVTDV